jgi:CBS domain-containing protein
MCCRSALRNWISADCNACPVRRLTVRKSFLPPAEQEVFIMQIKELMSRNVVLASPRETLSEVAQMMAERDIGCMPVGDGDRIVGMVTDRDIVIRGVAAGKGPDTPVSEVMTRDVKYCFDDEDIDHVILNMGENQVRRLPVMNREKRLVGIVTLADAALEHDPVVVGEAFLRVVEPGGDHCQSAA